VKRSGKTFTFYHCTRGKGSCSNVTYLREEKIDEAICKSLEAIRLDENVIEFTQIALLESHESERKFHDAAVAALTTRYKGLQRYIDRC
jgi:site-specific DNA recombinase